MLIDVLVKSRKGGYLGRELPGSLTFFPNNTLCLRRSMLTSVGTYDGICKRGEDVELCARISRSPWLLFLCTDMLVYHRARATLSETLAQWWGYGTYVPYIFRKHNDKRWELHVYRPLSHSASNNGPALRYRTMVYLENMPFTLCIFITPFVVLHGLLFATIIGSLLGSTLIFQVLSIATVIAWLWYVQPDITRTSWSLLTVKVALLRYLVNWAFVLSHFLNGLRYATIYIPQTICERAPDNAITPL